MSCRLQMTSKCVKNKKVAHKPLGEYATDVLSTFCICDLHYWTKSQQSGIHLFYVMDKPIYHKQGCCLMGARVPGALKLWVQVTKGFFKELEWAPKHGVFIPIQSVQWLQSQKKKKKSSKQ